MATGKIKRLNEKGFGFIIPSDGGKDIFFHAKQLRNVRFDDLIEGDSLSFNISKGDKGPQAVDIERV